MIYRPIPQYDIEQLETFNNNIELPEHIKHARLESAKGGTWYDGWKPFCMTCSTNERMTLQPYGFKCSSCGNMIGWNLTRLKESQLNYMK